MDEEPGSRRRQVQRKRDMKEEAKGINIKDRYLKIQESSPLIPEEDTALG